MVSPCSHASVGAHGRAPFTRSGQTRSEPAPGAVVPRDAVEIEPHECVWSGQVLARGRWAHSRAPLPSAAAFLTQRAAVRTREVLL